MSLIKNMMNFGENKNMSDIEYNNTLNTYLKEIDNINEKINNLKEKYQVELINDLNTKYKDTWFGAEFEHGRAIFIKVKKFIRRETSGSYMVDGVYIEIIKDVWGRNNAPGFRCDTHYHGLLDSNYLNNLKTTEQKVIKKIIEVKSDYDKKFTDTFNFLIKD